MLESIVNMENNSDEDSCASSVREAKKSLPSVNLLSPFDSLPASEKLFGGDLYEALKSTILTFTATLKFKVTTKRHFGQQFQPYLKRHPPDRPLRA